MVIILTDAPCHGNKYHESKFPDNHPAGDPSGVTPEELLLEMKGNKIQVNDYNTVIIKLMTYNNSNGRI
jgi:hypothetical protein